MEIVVFTYQEHMFADSKLREIELGISSFFKNTLKFVPLIIFVKVSSGNAYSAGAPSSTSIVMVSLPSNLKQPERSITMKNFASELVQLTGTPNKDILCNFATTAVLLQNINLLQSRASLIVRIQTTLSLTLRAFSNKLAKGIYQIPLNPGEL